VKFAAMEGQFRTQRHAPLRIGGWPDEQARTTRWAIEIPSGLSFLATHDPAAEIAGLDQVPTSDWPNVGITHLSFQVMVTVGMALVVMSVWFWWTYARHRADLLSRRWLLRCLVLATPLGFVGLEAGWFVTEVGRQPWIIQGVMRTSEAVTPAPGVFETFVAFTLLYLLLGVTVVVLLRRVARTSFAETAAAEKVGE
jgi:cytochrome d ubiquinol oxidase subunit I